MEVDRESYRIKKFKALVVLTLLSLFTACVPVEKVTECGSNEAYDPGLKRCVPTIGAGSPSAIYIESYGPTQVAKTLKVAEGLVGHFVAVKDSYQVGYVVNWKLHLPTGTPQVVANNTSSFTLDPQSAFFSQSGAYMLEATVWNYDQTTPLDTRTWAYNFIKDESPVVIPIDFALGTIFTEKNITNLEVSAYYDISLQVGAKLEWWLDGQKIDPNGGSITETSTTQFTTSKVTLNPSTLSSGNHILSAKITDGISTLYDEKQYNIFLKDPDFTGVYVSQNNTAAPNVTTTAVDGVPTAAGGIFQGVTDVNFCVYVDNYLGTANDLVHGSNVYAQFYLNGAKIGGVKNFQANGEAGRICITNLDGYTNFSFDHSEPVPTNTENQNLMVEVYDMGSDKILDPVLDYKITTYNWPINVRPKNTAPIVSVSTAMDPLKKFDPLTGDFYYELTQDSAFTFEITVTDNDEGKFIAGLNTDAQYESRWKLDGVLLDGQSNYLNTPVTTTDCFHTYGDTHASKLLCTVTIPSYTNTGINTQTDYTLTAQVSDVSFYPGGPIMPSSEVTFKIKTLEAQTEPTIQEMIYVGTTTNKSFISLQNDPSKPKGDASDPNSGILNERDDVILNISVQDPERDSYYRMIEMCRTKNLGVYSDCTIISGLQQIARSDSNEYHNSTHYFRIPETAVIGASVAKVYFKVTIQDTPTTLPGSAAVNGENTFNEFAVDVANNNPAPILTNEENQIPSREPAVPGDPVPEYYVYPGFPFTIYPGDVSDASLADGNNILYQWQVCEVSQCDVAGGWVDIPGGTEKNLVWTPPTEFEGQEINLRLCIGDDGFGNDLSSCQTAPSVPPPGSNIIMAGPWTKVFVKTNAIANFGQDLLGDQYLSSGEMAQWVDQSEVSPVVYTAYSSCIDDNDCRLVVDKVGLMTDGSPHMNSQTSIVITTESGGTSPEPKDITIIGDESNKALFVAYTVADVNTVPSGIQTIRVRRIDIRDGKFGFNYDGNGLTVDDLSTQNFVVDYQTDADGSSQIQFVNTALISGSDSITINSVSFFGFTDFAVEDPSDNFLVAEEFANAINTSSDPRIAGVVQAVATGSTVMLEGIPQNDFIDFQVYAKKLGRIMIDTSNNKLLLPFIDGLNDNKLSVIGMDSSLQLGDAGNLVDYVKITQSLEMTEIDNEMAYDGSYYFVKRSLNGFVYVYMYTDLLNANATPIMTGSDSEVFTNSMTNLKISAPKMGNDYAFVGGVSADTKLNIARISHSDFASGGVVLSKSEPLVDNTLFPNTTVAMQTMDYDLETLPNNPQECLLAVATSDDAAHAPDLRQRANILKIQSNDPSAGTSPIVFDEGEAYVSHSDEQVVKGSTRNFEVQLSTVISGIGFGSAGYNQTENYKDFVIYNYHSGTESNNKVISAIVNVQDEEIQVTGPGRTLAPYNPPFFNTVPPVDPLSLATP